MRKEDIEKIKTELPELFGKVASEGKQSREPQKEFKERNENMLDGHYNGLFLGTAYRIKNNALYRAKKTNDTEELFYLANFFIIPQAETVKDNGLDQERYFTLKPIFEGKELPTADIPADKFSSMNFIHSTWGLALRTAVGQNTVQYLKDSIQAQARNVAIKNLFVHTGWRQIKGKWAYLYQGGAVGIKDIQVELEGRLNRYILPEQGDYKEASKVALQLFNVAPKEITIPLVTIAFLSILNEFSRESGIEPSFIIFLLGPSGTMKSTLAALVLCFFGKFDNKSLPGSFKDTANSIEKQGFLLKDTLTVIDDFHPTSSRQESQKMESIAQSVTRAYGDRTGRNRMNSDTTLKKSYIPRGNAIITGEDVPGIGQSGTARHLTLELKKSDIDIKLLTELQNNAGILALSMRGFIEWIIPQIPTLPKFLKEQFTQLRQAASTEGQHNRLPEVVAHLQTGFLMMLEYFHSMDIISQIDIKNWASNSWDILNKLAESQSRRIQEDRPTTKFIIALRELLATNQCYCVPTDATSNNPGGIGFIGYQDDLYYYLYPEITFKEIVRFYQQQGENFPVSKNMLLKHLATEKLIFVDGCRNVRQKKIGNRNYNYLWLTKEALKISAD